MNKLLKVTSLLAVPRSHTPKSRSFQAVVLFAIVASCACSQLAVAQARAHAHVKVAPRNHAQAQIRPDTGTEPAPDLYPTWQGFAATPYPAAFNNDGTELWPCFGDTPTANPDCPSIGDPAVTFPIDAVAVGVPQYAWLLSACDGTTTGSGLPGSSGYIPCGQSETFYEDWTQDLTDDLLYEVVITQGSNTIVDTGIEDFHANYFGVTAADYPLDVVFSEDFNFGALGQTGKNNGNCFPSYNYPWDDGEYPGFFIIGAGKTCVDPVTGPATVTATMSLATPTIGTKKKPGCQVIKGKSVCYITFTTNYTVVQKSQIYIYAP